jgi:hypothetical protein
MTMNAADRHGRLYSDAVGNRTSAAPEQRGPFTTTLFRYHGKGAWHFAIIPSDVAPPATRPWGRTPVTATVDGQTWQTSLWRDTKSNRSLLAVPKARRRGKGDGDAVTVSFTFAPDDD